MPKSSFRPAARQQAGVAFSAVRRTAASTAIFGCTVLATALLGACTRQAPPPVTSDAPLPVAVASPEIIAATAVTPRYAATVARDREANLSFRVGGVIHGLPVRIGFKVHTGEGVADLDATAYRSARIRAEQDVARLTRASARSRELVPAGAAAPALDEDNTSTLEAARASLAAAQYDEDSAELRSPFEGVVLARQVEVGETVSPGQTIARVADLSSALIARAGVPRSIAAMVHEGDRARVYGDAGVPIDAIVRRIGAAADPKTGTVDIELTLPPASRLPSGAAVSVSFDRERAERSGGQRLPAEALLDAGKGQGHVYVVDPRTSTAHKVSVAIEGFDGDALRVSGLDPSAQVITAGAGFAREGQKVVVFRP